MGKDDVVDIQWNNTQPKKGKPSHLQQHGQTWKALRSQILCDITYMWNLKKYNKLVNETNKKKEVHSENMPTVGHEWGEAKGVIMEVYEILCVKHLTTVKH